MNIQSHIDFDADTHVDKKKKTPKLANLQLYFFSRAANCSQNLKAPKLLFNDVVEKRILFLKKKHEFFFSSFDFNGEFYRNNLQ